jgi:formate dehydrogenase iron-sulfur subunit
MIGTTMAPGERERQLPNVPQAADPPRGLLATVVERLLRPFLRGTPPVKRTATGFYTDTTVCIGCKACEVACKQWNQLPADGLNWSGNSYDNTDELSATSWRHVKFIEQFPEPTAPVQNRKFSLDLLPDAAPTPNGQGEMGRWLMMSDVCKHCITAPCQQACPTGALLHNEFENVYVQPDICNGCAYCVAACPFGVVARAHDDGHAHKCTLCYDRQKDDLVPACAKACPTQSIQFGPIEELRDRARKRVEDLHRRGITGAYLYGDTATVTYSALNSFYLLVDKPQTYGLPGKPFNPWLHMLGDYLRSVLGALVALAALFVLLRVLGG